MGLTWHSCLSQLYLWGFQCAALPGRMGSRGCGTGSICSKIAALVGRASRLRIIRSESVAQVGISARTAWLTMCDQVKVAGGCRRGYSPRRNR
jgi:hypothetical protein